MKTIIYKPILHVNTEDLPSLIHFDFLDIDEEDIEEIYLGNTNQLNDAIKIDGLIDILTNLKSEGCNYVSIDYHTDHREYELDGQYVGLATQQEIDARDQKEKDFQIDYVKRQIQINQKHIADLEKSLKRLSGE